jgi:myo-inositol 2-dehydrogenase/D-chiro-inositol 1-dehydrogenase
MKQLRHPRRRDFLRTAAVTGTGLLFVPAASVFGSPANSAVNLGIIGCGGRGNYVGGEFVKNSETRVSAIMDLFDDRLESTRASFDKLNEEKGLAKIAPENIFKGFRSYEKLVASKDVDIVLVTSPPYFHPDHLEAAVDAGKHVYCEKPVATDVYGCKRVIKAGEKAKGKLSIHVGFQKRYDVGYKAVVDRIHGGEIGPVVLGQTFYYTNDLDRQTKPGMPELEARLRHWVFDQALSGDIIVEQNIHIIDVVNWALKSHPVRAMGSCGRAVRKEVEGIPPSLLTHDFYILTFVYRTDAGEVQISFNSNQFRNKAYRLQGERFFGTLGVAETLQSGPATITLSKENSQRQDAGPVNLHKAVGDKIKSLVDGIKAGRFENQTEQGAETTLSTILGRTAATTGREVTWEKLVKSNDKWDLKLNFDSLGTLTTASR